MKLFDVAASPNCRKVRIVARELGLPLTIVAVDFATARTAEYLAMNPTGKVPVLVDEDLVLSESAAIVVHLAEKKPESGLFPAEARARAEVLKWMFFGASHLQPWVSLLGQERLIKARTGGAPDAGIIALAERELARFLPVVERHLATREHLAGDYSIADVVLGAGLVDCERRGVDLAAFPNIARWRARLVARSAWSD